MNDTKTKPTAPATHPDLGVSAAEPRPIKPLENNRLRLVCSSSSDICNLWAAVLKSGTPFEEVLAPEFWANVANRLRTGDQVQVHTDAGGFYGLLYVRDVSGSGAGKVSTRAIVAKLQYHEFGALTHTRSEHLHMVTYEGLHAKWCVKHVPSGKFVREGLDSKETAETAIKGMERSQVAAA
jgi:hypothetical protein